VVNFFEVNFYKKSFLQQLLLNELDKITMNNEKLYNDLYKDWTFENQTYTRMSEKERIVLNKLFEKTNFKQGATVLDVGCGIGWKSHLLSKMGFKVTGIDISDVAIDKAKQYWGKNEIDFKVSDLTRNNALDQQFDIVFASSFSLFKYDINEKNSKYGDIIFSYLKKDGFLIFDWAANSKWKKKNDDWPYFSASDANPYFSKYGEIIGMWASYRELFSILRGFALSKLINYLVLFASNFHGIGHHLYCLVRKD